MSLVDTAEGAVEFTQGGSLHAHKAALQASQLKAALTGLAYTHGRLLRGRDVTGLCPTLRLQLLTLIYGPDSDDSDDSEDLDDSDDPGDQCMDPTRTPGGSGGPYAGPAGDLRRRRPDYPVDMRAGGPHFEGTSAAAAALTTLSICGPPARISRGPPLPPP